MVVFLSPHLFWGTKTGTCRVLLFTCSPSESPRSIGSYYTSLERCFQGDHNAVGIVRNGSVFTEKLQKHVDKYGLGAGINSSFLSRLPGRLTRGARLPSTF